MRRENGRGGLQNEAQAGRRRYHHGDLRRALLSAVVDQVRASGPETVSLRLAAKAAGVSPAATFRHFADKRAVMTAIAIEGFERMLDRIEAGCAAAGQDKGRALHAVGAGYLGFALENPAHFRVMFRADLVDETDPDLRRAGGAVKLALTGRAQNEGGPGLSRAALLAWGVVHGLATLAIEGALDEDMPREGREAALADALRGMGPLFSPAGGLSPA